MRKASRVPTFGERIKLGGNVGVKRHRDAAWFDGFFHAAAVLMLVIVAPSIGGGRMAQKAVASVMVTSVR